LSGQTPNLPIASRQCRAQTLSTLCHDNKLGLRKLLLIIQTFVRSCIQIVMLVFSQQPLAMTVMKSYSGSALWQMTMFGKHRSKRGRQMGEVVHFVLGDVSANQIALIHFINYPLTPEHFTTGSNRKVYWRCRKGHSY